MKLHAGLLSSIVVGLLTITGSITWCIQMSKAQDNLPKKGDIIGGWGVGAPRSGEMPKAGDLLGGIGVGPPRPAQPAAPSSAVPAAAPPSSGTSNYSIGDIHDNRGIIQQGPNNTVNLAPQPELKGIQSGKTSNPDGSYTHHYLVEWTAEFPGDWRVLAYSKSILSVSTSSTQFGWSGIRPDHAFTTVSRPNGRYSIFVRTGADDTVELKHELIR
jgi:hypothetical protein